MLYPQIVAVPDVGGRKPVIIRIVVDLPAPFGPRKPSTSPLSTANDTPRTAWIGPKLRLRSFMVSIPSLLVVAPVPPGGGTEGFARSPPAGSAAEKELFRKSA